jgi:hypothetical protein
MEESKQMIIEIKLFPHTHHLHQHLPLCFGLLRPDPHLHDGQRIANQNHRLLKIEYLCGSIEQ